MVQITIEIYLAEEKTEDEMSNSLSERHGGASTSMLKRLLYFSPVEDFVLLVERMSGKFLFRQF